METQSTGSFESHPVSRSEKGLVFWLAVTFLLCIFVSLPDGVTDLAIPARRATRSYLRTIGLDQTWEMFVGDDWDIPQLRIIATDASGATQDVTQLLLHHGILHRHLLDDHVLLAHFNMARDDRRRVFPHYAELLRTRLGPETREIRFEAVHRTARVRLASGSRIPTAVVLLATYRWD